MNKRFKLIISGICALMCAAVLSVQVSAASFLTGDLNGDGEVTSEDALLILQHMTGIINEFPVDEQNNVSSEKIVANITTDDCSENIDYSGSTAVSLSLRYPVVEVPENKNASEAINQTLQRIRLQNNVKAELLEEVVDGWSYGGSKENKAYYEIAYDVCRNSNILSLKVTMARISYMSTASIGVHTFNFDLSTGALIDITDLTSINNYSNFAYDFAAPAIYKKVSKYNYISNEFELLNYIDNDSWYFDSDGNLNYAFSPYAVAALAEGIIEVNIGSMNNYMTDYYINLLK